MAFKYREEIVGKRFLSVSGTSKLKLSKFSEWEWRTGVIRAATHRDCKHRDLTVLVEFDGVDWKRREWIRVHEEGAFRVFLVEHTLVWALRKQGPPDNLAPSSQAANAQGAKNSLYWPALNFKPLVDNAALSDHKQKPLEYLVDRQRDFVDYADLRVYQEADWENQSATRDYPEVRKAIKSWIDFQDGQRILLTTPSVLVGYRVEVYRSEGTTQWYTAVIISYNENTRELTLTDDTVLEEHNEDPSLVQMNLIGDGVVESILKGENVGITPRRRACNSQHNLPGPYGTRTRSHSGQVSPAQVPNRPANSAQQGQSSAPAVVPPQAANVVLPSPLPATTAAGPVNPKKPRGPKELSIKDSPPSNSDQDKAGLTRIEHRRKSSSSSNEELSSPSPKSNSVVKGQQRNAEDDPCRAVNSSDRRRANPGIPVTRADDDHADVKRTHLSPEASKKRSPKTEVPEEPNGPSKSPPASVITSLASTVASPSKDATTSRYPPATRSEALPKNGAQQCPEQSLAQKAPQDKSKIKIKAEPAEVRHEIVKPSAAMHPAGLYPRMPPQPPPSQQGPPSSRTVPAASGGPMAPGPSGHLGLYGLSSASQHMMPAHHHHPGAPALDLHSPAYRHLLTQAHPMLPPGYAAAGPTVGLDVMWPQKFGPAGGPQSAGPWLMQAGSGYDIRLDRERAAMVAHERDRHRIEREKRDEQERIEREKAEREHREREKAEKERKDRERQDRERQEKEKAERDRLERERAQREAVQQHFEESLRLAGHKQWNVGWSPISNLPLSKTQASSIQNSNSGVVVSQSQLRTVYASEMEKERSREKMEAENRDNRYLGGMDVQERWYAAVHQHQQFQQQRVDSNAHGHSFPKTEQSRSSSNSGKPKMDGYMSHPGVPASTSSKSSSSSSLATSQSKLEASYSIYGYQPFHHTYITQGQLKAQEENRQQGPSHPSHKQPTHPHHPGAAMTLYSQEKESREGPLPLDRSNTPGSRTSTPIGRPPSLSPKHQVRQDYPGVMATSAHKNYDYFPSGPAPAHQSSSPNLTGRSSGTPHQYTAPHPVDQPQNLTKGEPKNGAWQGQMPQSQRYGSPKPVSSSPSPTVPTAYHPAKTSSNHPNAPPAGTTYSYSLIQQGLVPNPLYASMHGATTTGSPTASSNTTVVTSHQQPKAPGRVVSPNSAHHYMKSVAGITTGTPVCRPNNVAVYNHEAKMSRAYSPNVGPSPGAPVKPIPMDLQNRTGSAPVPLRGTPSPAAGTVSPGVLQITGNPGNHSESSSPRLTPNHMPHLPPSGSPQPHPNMLPGHPRHSPSMTTAMQMQPLNLQSSSSNNSNNKRSKPPKDPSIRTKKPKSGEDLSMPPQLQPQAPIPPHKDLTQRLRNSSPPPTAAALTAQLAVTPTSGAWKPSVTQAQPTMANIVGGTSVATNSTDSAAPAGTASDTSSQNKPVTGFMESFQSFVTTSHQVVDNEYAYGKIAKGKNKIKEVESQAADASDSATAIKLENPSSPTPSTCTNHSVQSSTSTNHTKLKKAWLQRHSETEDKKNNPAAPAESPAKDQIKTEVALTNPLASAVNSENSNSSTASNTNAKATTNANGSANHPTKDSRGSRSNSATPPNVTTQDVKEEGDSTSSSSEAEQELKKRVGKNTRVARKRSTVGQSSSSSTSSKRQKPVAVAVNDSTVDASSTADVNGVTVKKEKEDGKRKSPAPEKDVAKRRGRKPKGRLAEIANNKGNTAAATDDSNKKKTPKPFEKPSVAWLKRTGEPFLQDSACCDVAPKLPKCRECRMTPHQRSKKQPNIFCRFYAFRKLKYSKNNSLLSAGFSEPSDATPTDLKLWLPPGDDPPSDLDSETSKFLLAHVGDQFCDLVEQEREAQALHMGEDKTITWKRVVQGVREMCDVCETTLFNIHWVCHKCGFVVCIDCYKARKNGTVKEEELPPKDRDEYQWLLCNNRQPHEQEKLMLTQIIAGNALWDVGKLLHEVRQRWTIPSYCACSQNTKENNSKEEKKTTNGICKQLMSAVTKNFLNETTQFNGDSKGSKKSSKGNMNGIASIIKPEDGSFSSETGGSPLSWLADVALNSNKLPDGKSSGKKQKEVKIEKNENDELDDNGGSDVADGDLQSDGEDSKGENFSTLRELLIRPSGKGGSGKGQTGSRKVLTSTLDEVISCVIEHKVGKVEKREEKVLMHFTRRYPKAHRGREPLPIRVCTLTESRLLYPDVPHSWLCHGKLLLLHDPQEEGNLRLFQEQWKRGQPVVVADVSKYLDMTLWHPDGFCRDFGDIKNDLVNCKTGTVLPNQPMRKFWEGFENFTKRMKDEDNDYMLLKLKDWPPGEDFSELLPSRFRDLMKVLPLPHYTHRDGVLNLAGRLPECFVRPDLGPKMYNAYGSALYPTKGTTNLHLDISDAVNVMVYVGIPKDGKDEEHIQEALRAIDDGCCDSLTRKRVREKGVKPGALWHIYNARDADKIRDLLNKVAEEQGEKIEAHHDPIHDQSWYLDTELRDRLHREYGVEGYAIAQCLGDAVFIPAGAPHQVRNLHSCIKVAEDFVSPENVAHCFTLTQEFRHLSDTHTNHEDKLQIKNIIYHAVRDAMALLQSSEPSDK